MSEVPTSGEIVLWPGSVMPVRERALAILILLSIGSCAQSAPMEAWRDSSPHQVRFVTVAPDVQLEVLDWGGAGDDLVFLAGLSLNAHSFDDFAPRFTDTHRVLAITRRGHGASTWTDSGYSLNRLAEDLRALSGACTTAIQRYIYESMAGFAAGMKQARVAGLDDTQHVIYLVSPDVLEAVMRRWLATLPGER